MRTTLALFLTFFAATGCAGFLSFLDAHGRDVARAVLECVPEGSEPTPEDAAACLDAAMGVVDSLESAPSEGAAAVRGETVIACALALRHAEELRAAGEDPAEAEQWAAEFVDRLSR